MKIAILALDGAFDSGLTVLLDVFSTANELAVQQGLDFQPFEVRIVGLRKRVLTALGFSVAAESARGVMAADWIVVPALNAKQPEQLLQALARRDVRNAIGLIGRWHAQGVGIAGACVGTFLLAEAGLLDHRDATTGWPLAPLFRKRYPAVALDDTNMIVQSQRIVTAGSAMGHLDLALWLTRQASPALAAQVACFMLIDKRTSQASYMIPDHLTHADPLIAKFEQWARTHLASGFSLQEAAKTLAVGPRTLQRRTEAVLGKSPLAFFQDLRVERAVHLASIGYGIDAIAAEVGYADSATLRTLLRRKLGHGIRQLRQPF